MVMLKERHDGSRAQVGVSRVQIGGQLFRAVIGVLDRLHQHGNTFLGRGQRHRRRGGVPDRPLASGHGGVGGEIDVVPFNLFTLQGGMLMEWPEEGARVQAQALAQFSRAQPTGRLEDQGDNRLGKVAVAEKPMSRWNQRPCSSNWGSSGRV